MARIVRSVVIAVLVFEIGKAEVRQIREIPEDSGVAQDLYINPNTDQNVQVTLHEDQRRVTGLNRGLFDFFGGNSGWFWGGNSNPAPAPAPAPRPSGNGVDLSLRPLSCSIKRWDDTFYSGALVGTAKNIQTAELCVGVCWEFKQQGRKCGSVNYLPSTQTCELRDNVMSQTSDNRPQTGCIYMIPVNCQDSGSGGGSGFGSGGGSGFGSGGSLPGTCGLPKVTPSIVLSSSYRSKARIVGGSPAIAHSYPWIVSLQQGSFHFCGGTLIRSSETADSSDIIVTASHCLYDGPKNLRVVLGAHEFKKDTKSIAITAKVYKTHEYYDPETTENDIALVKLDYPVKFNDNIQPACLPNQGEPVAAGASAVVAGWGSLRDGKIVLPGLLMQVQVPVVADSQCKAYYPNDVNLRYMFCAGYDKGQKDSCQGDSGGPLIFKNQNSSYVLRGVVSFGEGCAKARKPGVYTKVSNYREWIDRNARLLTAVSG